MTNLLSIQDTLENRVSFWLLACFLVVLPVDRFYSEMILICFSIHTIIHLTKERLNRLSDWRNWIPCSLFFLSLLGLFWTTDMKEAKGDIEHQLAILILPLVLTMSGLSFTLYRTKLLLLFAASCTILILYLYFDAFHIILYNHLPLSNIFSSYFINHNFSEPIGIHATYFSMYISLCLIALVHYLAVEKSTRVRAVVLFSIFVLVAGLLQLASKSVLLATGLLIPVSLYFSAPVGRPRNRYLLTGILVSLLSLVLIAESDTFKNRLVTGLKNDLELRESQAVNDRLEPRMVRWEYIFKLIRKSPFLGYGTGSEKKLLKETYYENKLYNSYLHELNAHNEYLSTWLKTGLPGLLVLLGTFLFGLLMSFRNRDAHLFAFMILIIIVSLSENVADVNKGIFFYAFFFPFLLLSGKPFPRLNRLKI